MKASLGFLTNISSAAKKVIYVVSAIGAVTGLMAWLLSFLDVSTPAAQLVQSLTLLGILLIGILAFFGREIMIARKEKYANVTRHTHLVFHRIRDVSYYLSAYLDDELDGRDARTVLENAELCISALLADIARVFEILTGTTCRACIKTFALVDGSPYMFTLTRDPSSLAEECDRDKHRGENLTDPLVQNEHFKALYTMKESYYFNNDLPGTEDYRSTSLLAYRNVFDDNTKAPVWNGGKLAHWPLPYRSTIVCAIRHLAPADFEQAGVGVVGLLGIDSTSRNVFHEEWDAHLALAFADALMVPLQLQSKINAD